MIQHINVQSIISFERLAKFGPIKADPIPATLILLILLLVLYLFLQFQLLQNDIDD